MEFDIRGAGLLKQDDPHLSPRIRRYLEGASQTFPAGSPVVLTGGYIVAAASPATAIFGWAVQAGRNGSAGANYVDVIKVQEDDEIVANLLEASAADHTLAITDLGSAVDLVLGTNLLGTGIPGWYLKTPAAAGGTAQVTSFEGDQVPTSGRAPTNRAAVGDVNARVRARVLTAVISQ